MEGIATPSADMADECLAGFQLAKYRFTVRATTEIRLPIYKGSTTHGAFGHALQRLSPAFFKLFYQSHNGSTLPKPFVLTPPLESKTDYLPDELLDFELVLVGSTTQHLPICFAAFEMLGQEGFGNNKGRYRIERVDYADARGEYQPLYENSQWRFVNNIVNGQQIAEQIEPPKTRVTLQLQTRLRLKHNNQLLMQAPAFPLLLDRLLGRLCTLSRFYQQQPLLSREERNELLNATREIKTVAEQAHWNDWTRFSGRQKEWMKFGGLLGEITYAGDLAPFMPYLKLGEWLHVGGKTSFGLGRYRIVGHNPP